MGDVTIDKFHAGFLLGLLRKKGHFTCEQKYCAFKIVKLDLFLPQNQ